MYGLTETVARCSFVPPHWLPEKAHCVGIPIKDSSFSILVDGEETSEAEVEGEVIFRGPNVMMGYAEYPEDLTRGDELGGLLHTGDLGVLDEDGFLRIT